MVTARGLTTGTTYALLRFDSATALPPSGNFLASGTWSEKVQFVAAGPVQVVSALGTISSGGIYFYRCVAATASGATSSPSGTRSRTRSTTRVSTPSRTRTRSRSRAALTGPGTPSRSPSPSQTFVTTRSRTRTHSRSASALVPGAAPCPGCLNVPPRYMVCV